MIAEGEHTYRRPTLPVAHDPIREYLNVWNTPQGRMIQAISGVCGRKKEDLLDTSTLLEQLDLGDHTHLNEEAHDLAVKDMTQFCTTFIMPRGQFQRCVFDPGRRFQSFTNVKSKEDFIKYIMSKREQRENQPIVAANLGIYADNQETFKRNFQLAKANFERVEPPKLPVSTRLKRVVKNMTTRKQRQRATPNRRSGGRLRRITNSLLGRTETNTKNQQEAAGESKSRTPIADSPSATTHRRSRSNRVSETDLAVASGGESKNNIVDSPSATPVRRRGSPPSGTLLDYERGSKVQTQAYEQKTQRRPLKVRAPRQLRVDLRDVVMFQDVDGNYEPVDREGFEALKSKYYQLLCQEHANNTLADILNGKDTHIPYSDEVVSAIDEAWANIRANFPQLKGTFESFAFPTRRRKRRRSARANDQIRRRLFKYIGTLIPPYSRYMARHELERIDQVQREAYENLHEAIKDVVK